MLEIVGIDHIVLRTTKLSEMLHFYSEILGCKIEREMPPKIGLTQLRAGIALIDLVTVDSQLGQIGGGPPSASENNVDHFCLQLAPITEESITEYLNKYQIDTGDFIARYGAEGMGNSIYIKDPEGNTVELRVKQNI